MLTRKHLAVLRAALQYFQEELVPHGRRTIQPYLDEPIEGEISPFDVKQLQQFLRDAELKYATVVVGDHQRIAPILYDTEEVASQAVGCQSNRVAVVLIPPVR